MNVLLNYYNFDGEWAREKLQPYIVGRVLILPLAFRERDIFDEDSWQAVYGKGGEKYDNIIRPFLFYGVKEEQISWLDYFDENADHIVEINNADILFFTGGMPEKAVARIDKLGLRGAIMGFGGLVMGASAGAMLQLDRYHVTPDEDYDEYGLWEGLGLVDGLDVEVHFLDTDLQNECSRRAVVDLSRPIFQIWHEGGLIVDGDKVLPLGSVRVIKQPT